MVMTLRITGSAVPFGERAAPPEQHVGSIVPPAGPAVGTTACLAGRPRCRSIRRRQGAPSPAGRLPSNNVSA